MRVSSYDDANKKGKPLSKSLVTPDRQRTKKQNKSTIQHSYKIEEMLPTIHQRTQDDDNYDYPAAGVPGETAVLSIR